jgi:dienelactone hydrolase
MRDAGVADWRLEVYGGVGHSFTNPDVGQRMSRPGFAYDAMADRRSWRSTLDLLDDVLGSAAHAGEDRPTSDVSSAEDDSGR